MESGYLDVLLLLGAVILIGLVRWAWNYIRWRDALKAVPGRRRASDPDRIVDNITDRDHDAYDGRPEP